jgi:hypothetical protein
VSRSLHLQIRWKKSVDLNLMHKFSLLSNELDALFEGKKRHFCKKCCEPYATAKYKNVTLFLTQALICHLSQISGELSFHHCAANVKLELYTNKSIPQTKEKAHKGLHKRKAI